MCVCLQGGKRGKVWKLFFSVIWHIYLFHKDTQQQDSNSFSHCHLFHNLNPAPSVSCYTHHAPLKWKKLSFIKKGHKIVKSACLANHSASTRATSKLGFGGKQNLLFTWLFGLQRSSNQTIQHVDFYCLNPPVLKFAMVKICWFLYKVNIKLN